MFRVVATNVMALGFNRHHMAKKGIGSRKKRANSERERERTKLTSNGIDFFFARIVGGGGDGRGVGD